MRINDSGTSNSKMRIGIAKARFPGEFIPAEHPRLISAWKYFYPAILLQERNCRVRTNIPGRKKNS